MSIPDCLWTFLVWANTAPKEVVLPLRWFILNKKVCETRKSKPALFLVTLWSLWTHKQPKSVTLPWILCINKSIVTTEIFVLVFFLCECMRDSLDKSVHLALWPPRSAKLHKRLNWRVIWDEFSWSWDFSLSRIFNAYIHVIVFRVIVFWQNSFGDCERTVAVNKSCPTRSFTECTNRLCGQPVGVRWGFPKMTEISHLVSRSLKMVMIGVGYLCTPSENTFFLRAVFALTLKTFFLTHFQISITRCPKIHQKSLTFKKQS